MKNKKTFNRLLGFVIIAIIVIIAVIQTPEILLPVVVLVEIILFGAGLRFLLNLKYRLDQKGKIDYGKISSVVIVIASVAGTILVGYIVSAPLPIVAVVVGLILAILFYYRDKRKTKSKVVKFKTRNRFHSKFKNNSFVRTIDSCIDPFLKKFFPDTKTRNISKVVICIMLIAVVLGFVIPDLMEIIKGGTALILAIYVICSKIEKSKE